jgi:hypothetical protein
VSTTLARQLRKKARTADLNTLQDRHDSLLMCMAAIVKRHGRQEFTREEVETCDPTKLIFNAGEALIEVRLR